MQRLTGPYVNAVCLIRILSFKRNQSTLSTFCTKLPNSDRQLKNHLTLSVRSTFSAKMEIKREPEHNASEGQSTAEE